ncbi:patatin-like phospholipase family protein [Agrobacterium tumefaciens]|uniref:patatin-like phospholipase family protein n=1 Tax=Agrobacterium tumefaciens TaxID=358 RepID=UPI003B282276
MVGGAFTVGVLSAWSELGTRPRFQVVTGVSTGALIAPFAFLGTQYDMQLRSLYLSDQPAVSLTLTGEGLAFFPQVLVISTGRNTVGRSA